MIYHVGLLLSKSFYVYLFIREMHFEYAKLHRYHVKVYKFTLNYYTLQSIIIEVNFLLQNIM